MKEPSGTEYNIDRHDFSFMDWGGDRVKFDFAYITIMGAPGENGQLQGYFDMLGIKYQSSGVLASALAMDKYRAGVFMTSLFDKDNIEAASPAMYELYETNSVDCLDSDIPWIKFPAFVKPNNGGSSYGITKVKKQEELFPALIKAFD